MKDSSTAATSPSTSTSTKEKSGATSTPSTPTSTSTAPTNSTIFRDARAELVQFIKKKEEIEKSLKDIEEQIYAFETSYLKQTQDTGNCIRGWSHCLTGGNANHNSIDKSAKFRESDRLFSYSSATSCAFINRDRVKREREKDRRKPIRKNRDAMPEFSSSKKNSENHSQPLTQPLNEDLDEDLEDEDESTTSSEKPASRSHASASASTKKKAKIKRLQNKRTLSDSSQQSESRD